MTGINVAVDLGTTNISLAADRTDPNDLHGEACVQNAQTQWGADVMTRLLAASHPATATELQNAAIDSIGAGLDRLGEELGFARTGIARIAVVGNAAMLALLTGRNHQLLLDPAHWKVPVACAPIPHELLQARWGLPARARIEVVQPMAGLLGSDLLAGLLATRIDASSAPALLMDVGANSEIALWDGQQLFATSAAGGAVFEGVGISCGAPASVGAVCRVHQDATGRWHYDVIQPGACGAGAGAGQVRQADAMVAEGDAIGICASGLVDAVALLRGEGKLTRTGQLRRGTGSRISLPGSPFWLTTRDIELLARAKAVIGSGCEVVCRRAGIGADRLEAVHVAGALGGYLDAEHASSIGLVPAVAARVLQHRGNTALAGCRTYLADPSIRRLADELRARVQVISLATAREFEDAYFRNLYLRPTTW